MYPRLTRILPATGLHGVLMKGKLSAGRSSIAWVGGDWAANGWGMVIYNRPAGRQTEGRSMQWGHNTRRHVQRHEAQGHGDCGNACAGC